MPKILYPHQEQMLDYCLAHRQGQLWCEPRTGKTVVAIRAMLHYKAFPLLIVTLKTLAVVWRDELIEEGFAADQITIFQGSKKKKQELAKKHHAILIVNYEALNDYDALNIDNWEGIILDESIKIANPQTKMSKYVLKNMKKFVQNQSAIYCLSGSPATESPVQYAPQYLASTGTFMEYTSFSDYVWTKWKWNEFSHKFVPRYKKHLEEIKTFVQEKSVCITRESAGIGSVKFYEQRECKFNKLQLQAIKDIHNKKEDMQRFSNKLGGQGFHGDAVNIIYENMVCAGIHPLTKEIISYEKVDSCIDFYMDTREPILVVGQFILQLKAAYERAVAKGIKCGIIYGKTKESERELLRHQFQNGEIDMLFGQVRAIKMGLNFARASHTHYISNSYSLDDRLQSEDRTTHLTKKEPVIIVDYVTPDRVDFDVTIRLKDKKKISMSYLETKWRARQ